MTALLSVRTRLLFHLAVNFLLNLFLPFGNITLRYFPLANFSREFSKARHAVDRCNIYPRDRRRGEQIAEGDANDACSETAVSTSISGKNRASDFNRSMKFP